MEKSIRTFLSLFILLVSAPVIHSQCNAAFEWEQIPGTLQIHFVNQSTSENPPFSNLWNFGDSHMGDGLNPTHTYDAPGTYNVCLIIEDEEGCIEDVCHMVTVAPVSNECNAAFGWEQGAGLLIHFINNSTSNHDIISYQWNFGDGYMGDGASPNHTYAVAGEYLVCLIITDNVGCVSDVCHEVLVEGTPAGCNAAFEWEQINSTLQIHFVNHSTSGNPPFSNLWNFGDGHIGDGPNPTHTYGAPGVYLVCLTIEDEEGCVDDVCHEVTVEGVPDGCNANFEWEQGTGLLVHFFNTSTSEHDIVSNIWNFGDGHVGDGENPNHTYEAPGTYLVCLIIESETGCVSDVCHEITVEGTPGDCHAAFEWEQGAGLLVHFINQSTSDHDIISYQWNFGDGHMGDGQNPNHTYEEPGTYLVCLIITDGTGCVSDVCHEVVVEGNPSGCDADFEWEGNGLVIHFFSTSTSEHDIISYVWHFGDGTEGDGNDPVHTYGEPGLYHVCLIITDGAGCVSDVCHDVQVGDIPEGCHAAFEWEQGAGLLVHFINHSTSDHDIISYQWNFGDGHMGDGQNPHHTYEEPGTYLVCLIITDGAGCVSDVCHEVVVDDNPGACQAGFNWEQGTGLVIHFINTSTEHDIITYQWNFGDGHMGDGENPHHTYEAPGTYLVCLIITVGSGCVSDVCHEVVVEQGPEGCHAAFEWEQAAGSLLVHFINHSTSDHDIISYQWNFGDGHMGDGQNPHHTYAEPGTYLVCLIITDGAGCVSDVCHEVVVEGGVEGCHASFNWEQGDGLLVHFINTSTSNHDIISYHWIFGDGHMADSQNPNHIYDVPGTYLVCLIITDGSGCVSDVCHEVVVEDGPEECNAGFFFEINLEGVVFFVNTSTGVSPDAQWLWQFGDGETSTEENPHHDYAEPGIYTVCLFINDPSTDCVDHFCIPIIYEMVPLGLIWLESNNDFQTENESASFNSDEPIFRYTNPASDELVIDYQLSAGAYNRVELYDLTGYMLISKDLGYEAKGTHRHNLDVRNSHPGIYIISFTIGNRRITKAVTITK